MSYDYLEKLKDPRWQKKRLEVFNRAGFKCECCEGSTSTLNVHHLVYSKGEPWDAPDDTLECLCEVCHSKREEFNRFFGGRCIQSTLVCRIFLNVFCDFFSSGTRIEAFLGDAAIIKLCHRAIAERSKTLSIKEQTRKDSPTNE